MSYVTHIIILSERFYAFGATSAPKQRNNKTPEQNKKTIIYRPERFLNDDLVDKSAVWRKFRRLIVSLFYRFVVLQSGQKSHVHFIFLNFKRVRRRSRRSPWRFGRPNLSARSRRDTSVKYLNDGSRDTEKAFCVKSTTNKNARFVSVVRKIRG